MLSPQETRETVRMLVKPVGFHWPELRNKSALRN